MAGTDPRNKLLGAAIGAAAVVLAAYLTGTFGLVISLINSRTSDKAPTQAPPSIVVAPIITNTNNVSTSEQHSGPIQEQQPKPTSPNSAGLSSLQEQFRSNPGDSTQPNKTTTKPATAALPSPGVCNSSPDRSEVHLVLPLKDGADLYADGRICREQIPSKVNMTIFLPNGTHHLVLKRDGESCSAYATVPTSKDESVILRCE